MLDRRSIAAAVVALFTCVAVVQAQDAARYPDWSGQWRWTVRGANRYDPTKAVGRAQQAPLTPEYQAIFEAGLADQAAGGQGNNASYACIPAGMPRDMAGNQGLEFVVTPKTTHVVFVNAMPRRIYTDGRSFPDDVEPTFAGYSIGKWFDEDGDGVYDTLEVETRNFNGPRTFDNAGIPLHADNQTIVKERIWRDKANPEIMHNEVTTIDHALTGHGRCTRPTPCRRSRSGSRTSAASATSTSRSARRATSSAPTACSCRQRRDRPRRI